MFSEGVEPTSLPICEPASPGDLRFNVGRSGSSEGALPPPFDDAVSDVVLPEPEPVSAEVCRFIVGRSGSSAVSLPPLFVELVSVVLPEDAELVSEVRRFIVGLSESSADEFPEPAEPVCTGFPLLSERCGFESDAELVITGNVFEARSGALFLAITGGL